jgi:galactose-1-phosphate uridylyltransferase
LIQRTPQEVKKAEEQMAQWKAKNERELQRQIVQYLRQRNIEVIWHGTHKKSTATKGTPDILFSVLANGFPKPCAYEVKFGTAPLEREQAHMIERMRSAPNCWRVRIIRSFMEVVDDLREMGL